MPLDDWRNAFYVYRETAQSMREILRSPATWKWALLALVLVAVVIGARMFPLLAWVKSFAQWAEQLGTAGALLYGVVFGLMSMLMLPSIPFTIVAGFAFGMVKGSDFDHVRDRDLAPRSDSYSLAMPLAVQLRKKSPRIRALT